MPDQLMKKLMLLFDQCLTQAAAPNAEETPPKEASPLEYFESNSFFIRESHEKSIRILTPYERTKLTRQSASFLEYLLQLDLFGSRTRELILNQLTLQQKAPTSLQEVKWTIFHTLADSLTARELGYLAMILFDKPQGMTAH